MDFLIAFLLAIVQGITEFLPISSSAHLILPSQIFNFPDQGLLFDTAVHGGTLMAVSTYYRKDILAIINSWTRGIKKKKLQEDRMLAVWIALASLPVLACGYYFYDIVSGELRNVAVITATTIIFAPLLWWSYLGDKKKSKPSGWIILLCGFSQILALVPGVSRSGITITCALAAGYTTDSAARISFLLSIPTIGAAFAYGMLKVILTGELDGVLLALIGFVVSGVLAYLTIGIFLRLLNKVGMAPFVIYRMLLGLTLFAFVIA
ncbi:MAG: undecaprenyl-diphosphate phosphatase [Candidatus Portiera sp.]|nr:undecaprenyl-diphosphate phosphatase [Portiera sp.]